MVSQFMRGMNGRLRKTLNTALDGNILLLIPTVHWFTKGSHVVLSMPHSVFVVVVWKMRISM